MFKKFADLTDRIERLEIYNLLKFNFGVGLKLTEVLVLSILIAGLGWVLATPLLKAGFWLGSALTVGLMLLILQLARLPYLVASSQLEAAFGLDPRSAARRLKSILSLEGRRLGLIWLVSTVLLWGLKFMDLWLWTLATLVLCALLTALAACRPNLWRPEKLRPPREGELPPELLDKIERWRPRTGLSEKSLAVSTVFSPELEPPRLSGLGSKIIISEKALAAFPPRELSLLAASAALGALVKAPLKFLLLRFCALAVAIPLSAIMISTFGSTFWLYPMTVSPALITLVWAGLWLGLNLAEFASRLTARLLDTQLAAAASVLLRDEEAPGLAANTLAERNLEPEASSAWREIFRKRYTRRIFTNKVKYQLHLSKFSG